MRGFDSTRLLAFLSAMVSSLSGETTPTRFYGATRSEPGKAVNDDAFACLGERAILLDGLKEYLKSPHNA